MNNELIDTWGFEQILPRVFLELFFSQITFLFPGNFLENDEEIANT